MLGTVSVLHLQDPSSPIQKRSRLSPRPQGILVIVVQPLSYVPLLATPWIAAHQASLSFTSSQSSLKLMFIESVMPSDHRILCRPLFLLPSLFLLSSVLPSFRVFSSESDLHIRWPKYWSFSFSISPSNESSELISLVFNKTKVLQVSSSPPTPAALSSSLAATVSDPRGSGSAFAPITSAGRTWGQMQLAQEPA